MRISLLLIAAMWTSVCCAQMPTAGLVAWYPFNGTATDTTGNNNDGIVNGASLATDRFGRLNSAYSFNGINSSITGNTFTYPTADNPRTISFWFTVKSTPGISEPFVMVSYGAMSQVCGSIYGGILWQIPSSTKQLGSWEGCMGSSPDRMVTYNYNLNTWYHMVLTYDSGFQRIYLNDTLIDTATIGSISTQNGVFSFGKAPGSQYYHNGNLDDIAIYNRALTRCEIHKLYDTTVPFVQHPQSVTAQPATDTIFVIQSPVANRQIQWQVNTGSGYVNLTNTPPYSGVHTDTLRITTITESMNNYLYRAVLTYPGLPCSETSGAALLSVIPSGIATLSNTSLTVFPNPFNNDITVKWAGPKLLHGSLRVTDIAGRQLYLRKDMTSNNISIPAAALAPGFYTISIYEGATLLKSQKVTKQ